MAEERHPLHDLFEEQIKDLYSAENQIIKALPKMAKNATNPQLRTAFERHLEETRNQVARLQQIAEELDFSPKGKKCAGMEGLIEEGKEVMSEFEEDTLDEEGRTDKKLSQLAESIVNVEALQEA